MDDIKKLMEKLKIEEKSKQNELKQEDFWKHVSERAPQAIEKIKKRIERENKKQ